MGSSGIKRRKPKNRLPRLKRMRIEDPTPGNVMWPEKGSGFEASPFSPAGTAQRWWLIRGNLRYIRERGLKIPVWPVIAVPLAAAAIVAVGSLLVLLVERIL